MTSAETLAAVGRSSVAHQRAATTEDATSGDVVSGNVVSSNAAAAGWMVAGLLVSGIGLGTRSLWQDEAMTAGVAFAGPDALWDGIVEDRGIMAASFLVTKLPAAFGESEWLLRLPSAVSVALMLGIVWRLVDSVAGAFRAHCVAALTLTSVGVVYYGQEARSYALTALMAMAVLLTAHRALQAPDRVLRWGMLWLAVVVGVYSHIVLLFSLPALFVLTMLRTTDRNRWTAFGTWVMVGLASLPIVIGATVFDRERVAWLPPLGPRTLARNAMTAAGEHFVDEWSALSLVRSGALLLLAAAGCWWLWTQRRSQTTDGLSPLDLVVIGAVAPFVLMTVASVASPLTSPRYYLHLTPIVALAAVIGVERVTNTRARTFVLASLLVIGAARVVLTYGQQDVAWSEVAAFVDDNADDGDLVHAVIHYERAPFDYYHWRDGTTTLFTLDGTTQVSLPQLPMVEPSPAPDTWAGRQLFLIDARSDDTASNDLLSQLTTPHSVSEPVSFDRARVFVVTFDE